MPSADALFRPDPHAGDEAAMIAEAMHCVAAFTDRFNARDLVGMDEHLHFPHIILSGEKLVLWARPGQLPASFFDDLHRVTGWVRTTYHRKEVVLVSPRKVHLLVDYTRDQADGSVASRHHNLWVVTLDGNRWGIKQRSY